MKRSATSFYFLLALIFSGCLNSTGPDESCEDFDRQEQAQFYQQNAENEGVIVTDSGLQFKVLEEGDGSKPSLNSVVQIEFEGRRIDGSIFDSTRNIGPVEIEVSSLIDGLEEGLQLMSVGSTYEFVVPSSLGYGETSSGPFCPGATLIFEVTLNEIVEN